jgi:putative ABC transport system permease protein
VSNAVAWPAAYLLMTGMLNNYAYRTGIALWVFLSAGAAAVITALLTVCIKIMKAAHADPVDSLRYE